MSTFDGHLALRALSVAMMLMVVASMPVGATLTTTTGTQSLSSASQGDSEGGEQFSFSTDDLCVDIEGDDLDQCVGATNSVSVTPNEHESTTSGELQFRLEVTTDADIASDQYEVEAQLDDGNWSSTSMSENSTLLAVDNTYPPKSIQYPTLRVRIIDSTTETELGNSSVVLENGYYVEGADEQLSDNFDYDEDGNLIHPNITNPITSATISYEEYRHILQPTHSTPNRFVDGDGEQESFEESSIPPARDGDLIGSAQGDVQFFENLRESGGFPAIFSHDEGEMDLGMMYYSAPVDNYAKIRLDYALQTENEDQSVQVNVVDRKGNIIDDSKEGAESRQLHHTVSQEEIDNYNGDYFKDRQQYENAIHKDTLETTSLEFDLTNEERQFIQDNNEAYLTFDTDNRSHLLLYRAPIISQTVEDPSGNNSVPDRSWFEEDFDNEPRDNTSATFDAEYRVNGPTNDEFGTIDRKPGEPLNIQVTVTNNGTNRVERNIGVFSISEENETHYDDSPPTVIDRRTVAVEPKSQKTVMINKTWKPHEFGNHSVTVVDTTDPTNNYRLSRNRDNKKVTEVYVMQPATFEVRDVTTPDSWLIHDNFNTTVVVENVGDLDGSGALYSEFQEWSTTTTIPETEGGTVRKNDTGGVAEVSFDREGYNYSPSHPERPSNGDDSQRPMSPYGSKLTNGDNGHNESVFTAKTLPEFAKPNPAVHNSLVDEQDSDEVRIYKLEIQTLFVEGDRDNSDTWYASGWGYADDVGSPYWSADTDASEYDIDGEPTGGLPVYGYQYFYPPAQVGDPTDKMNATVRVRNNGSAHVGTARVSVTTDAIGLDASGVAGTAGATLDPFESKDLSVPVVIRNDPGNAGPHNLQAEVRTSPDYIHRTNEDFGAGQLNATETYINVEVWDDHVFRHVEGESVINERCAGTMPDPDSDGEPVQCDESAQENYSVEQWHMNMGGTNGTLEVDSYIHAYSDPTGASDFSDFGWLGGDNDQERDYFDVRERDMLANQNASFAAEEIPLNEPGIYATAPYPHRMTNDGPSTYERVEQVPEGDWHLFKVLDITDPEVHAEVSDTSYPCKSGSCDASDGDWTVWEGATVEFENQSADNVGINTLQWSGAEFNGGQQNCQGEYCYSGSGYNDDDTSNKPVHRFDSPGSYDISLQVWDYPEYGAGATVNSDGTPNTDEQSWDFEVKSDNNDPSVSVSDSGRNNPDGSPDGSTVWESYGSTNYDGVAACFTASASDGEIGIESDTFDGISGDKNQDTRCSTWSSTGTKTVDYTAWDFAGNSDSDSASVTVEHDNSDPSASLSGSRSSMWVDKAHHSSSVSWRGSTGDGETGLINCGDGGAYSWSGDTNGDASSCSDSFTTDYGSASESGTTFSVDLTAEDYHGNTESDSASVVQYEDKTSPYASGGSDSCSAGYSQNGCSVKVCVEYYDRGPSGGIGIHSTSGAGGDACVTASANAYASANANANEDQCGEWDHDTDTDTDTDTDYSRATVTVEDKHGNTATATITASASDKDSDSDSDSDYGGDCPPEPDPPDNPCGFTPCHYRGMAQPL